MDYSRVEYGKAQWHTQTIESKALPQRAFNKDFNLLAQTLLDVDGRGKQAVLMCANEKQVDRFQAIFEDLELAPRYATTTTSLHEGFEDEVAGFISIRITRYSTATSDSVLKTVLRKNRPLHWSN